MDMFARGLAPINSTAWEKIEDQAASTLRSCLSARRFVDIDGPYGWERSCVNLGTLAPFERKGDVEFARRHCIQYVESRVEFSLDRMDLHNIERGYGDPDLVPVERAASAAAAFEDKMVFEGLAEAGIEGMKGHSEHKPIALPTDCPGKFLAALKDAATDLEIDNGIGGPYALVGGRALRHALDGLVASRTWLELVEANSPIKEYIYTPNYDGAFLVSTRGGDFELSIGGEYTIGYKGTEGHRLVFFIASSAAFRVREPRAFVELTL